MYKYLCFLVFLVLIQVIGNALAGENPNFGGPSRGNDNDRDDDNDRNFGRGRDRWTWCRCQFPRRRGGRDEL